MAESTATAPAVPAMLGEVLQGLKSPEKELPCKYFYDTRGSELFDAICELPEYYPTRTEIAIYEANLPQIRALTGPEAVVIEFGSGSGIKTRMLLEHLDTPAAYIPIEISTGHLEASAAALAERFPHLDILPLNADYTRSVDLPAGLPDGGKRLVFFPGSTIGNFTPREAEDFLRRAADLAGRGGSLLIGVDLKKDPDLLHAAYNDSSGLTAAFNKNILRHLNETLDADFDEERFRHYAFYNPMRGCIEMHLVSLVRQSVRIGGETVSFDVGESIRTERSYKFTPKQFERLANRAGFVLRALWIDADELFSVHYYEVT